MGIIVRCLIVPACLFGFPVASAQEAAPAAVGPPAAASPAPDVDLPDAPVEERRSHPPVSMVGFSRKYQAIRMTGSDADAAILAALMKPVDASMKLQGTSLRAAISLIRDVYGIPCVIDMQSLEDAGLDVDHITIDQEPARTRLSAALRTLFQPAGLTWVIADESLTVTTKDRAQEDQVVVGYPLPRAVGDTGPTDFQQIIELVQNSVAKDTWDTVGGQGAIRPLERDGDPLLVVSQTEEIHEEIERLLRVMHERFLEEFATGKPVLRVHHVADDAARDSLADSLVQTCNAALGDAGDAQAGVKTIGDSVAILSKSPEFHTLAARIVAAVDGVTADGPTGMHAGPGMGIGGHPHAFCWVAREVYGARDPRWLAFRSWVLTESPPWFRDTYGRHGSSVADWLRHRPAARAAVRAGMDAILDHAADGH